MALWLTSCALAGFTVALGWQMQTMVAVSLILAGVSFFVQLSSGSMGGALETFLGLVLFQGAYVACVVLGGLLSIGRGRVSVDAIDR